MDRMALNAAIARLIESRGEDGDAATQIISALHNAETPKFIEGSRKKKDSGGSFTGMTDLGQVSIKDEDKRMKEVWSFGGHKERIGHYKAWRADLSTIALQFYFGSDVTTESANGPPPLYYLGFNKDLSPSFFGEVVTESWITFKLGRSQYSLNRFVLHIFTGQAMKTNVGYQLSIVKH